MAVDALFVLSKGEGNVAEILSAAFLVFAMDELTDEDVSPSPQQELVLDTCGRGTFVTPRASNAPCSHCPCLRAEVGLALDAPNPKILDISLLRFILRLAMRHALANSRPCLPLKMRWILIAH